MKRTALATAIIQIDLGAMNTLLLEKVEELTRYVIDLQNQIDELKKGKE